jgi:uncharacterized membrane protein YhaH (DUF805 family)
MTTVEEWPEQSRMRQRSNAIARSGLWWFCFIVAAILAKTVDGPAWLRYGMFFVVVVVVQLFIGRVGWPDDTGEMETED